MDKDILTKVIEIEKEIRDILNREKKKSEEEVEKVRHEFLAQNAYTEDAFSPPDKTITKIKEIVEFHDNAAKRLKEGISLDEIIKNT